jgi:hypothetical protein
MQGEHELSNFEFVRSLQQLMSRRVPDNWPRATSNKQDEIGSNQ